MHLHASRAHRDAALQLFHEQVRIDPGADVAAEKCANPRVFGLPFERPGVEAAHALVEHRQYVFSLSVGAAFSLLFEHLRDDHVVEADNRFNVISSHVLAAGVAVGPAPFERQTATRKDERLLLGRPAEMDVDIDDGGHLALLRVLWQAVGEELGVVHGFVCCSAGDCAGS